MRVLLSEARCTRESQVVLNRMTVKSTWRTARRQMVLFAVVVDGFLSVVGFFLARTAKIHRQTTKMETSRVDVERIGHLACRRDRFVRLFNASARYPDCGRGRRPWR